MIVKKTGEYSLIQRKRLGEWIIEIEFLDGEKAVLHRESNETRCEGVFWYLHDNSPDTVRLARELIRRENEG